MRFLELTLLDGRKTLVNMSKVYNVVEDKKNGWTDVNVVVETNGNSASFRVKESLLEIYEFLRVN